DARARPARRHRGTPDERGPDRMKLEDVVDEVGNRFATVVVSARRARQINAYFHQLGEG
ncbi:MAG: DNA-directed RNA polymerase subunit omega, partial [Actinobacteria bacterium]|nr:DNA-directed RNA polymerase subunit omega [Actinomycetota bacterium]NIS28687.1 DNA-directed RNA polymerase subunit omega [Actinomycetota bacterium]NIT94089.1 DNA-directed RNA polymerase subunit omega [Actinomycetota bacterium]NIU17714.1 DNA-directed RNA polymerase subunit omega [Actinomycetota bacterium]NIU64151.1 DNA-directed RNA polymerase subunit omega [Actinomycetota bacterium]